MQDLQDFKNDITLILSKDRLETYDNLEQYKENLKLISLITPKISNLEIYLRNALDYCLTQIKGNEWVFDEVSLIPLIEELKDKKKEITHSLVLSKMSLEAVIKLIRNRAYHWENLLKLRANNRPRITTRFIRELEKPTSKSFNFGIMPNKIVSFLDDLIKSIGNKDLEKLSSL
ncbi:CAAX protease [Helicobacter pylori]|nr:CAAX protease [Helicobacter pylori]